MPEESVAEPAEMVDGEPEDVASKHRSRVISCAVKGSTEQIAIDAPDEKEPEAITRSRSRIISSSVKDIAEVVDASTPNKERPPPPVEAARGGGVA